MKILRLFALSAFILMLMPLLLVGQSPASVVWKLTTLTDGVHPSVITGNLSARDISGTDTFKIRSYSGAPVGPLGENHMRWWPTIDSATGLSWGLETAENPNRYIQLAVSPLAGNSFTSDSITIWHHAGGTSGMRLNCYASTDPTFATKTKLNPGDTAIWLQQNGTTSIRYAFAVQLTANDGQTFYYRAYPWYTGAASTSKYVYTQLAEIKGTTTSTTGVDGSATVLPFRPTLHQNYPNPFNPSTTIGFSIPNRSNVRLAVFNMVGQQVRVLLNAERIAGHHEVRFDAAGLPSGLYLVNMTAGGTTQTRAIHLVK